MKFNKTKNSYIEEFLNLLFITIGASIAAYALACVLVPNSILDGGVTGVSIILNLVFDIKLSLLILLINMPFMYIGYKNLGKRFLLKAVYSIFVFSLLLEVSQIFPVLTDNKLLATIYGSLILGTGVGIVLRFGGCLDGTESLGIVISKNTNLSVGKFVLFCNTIIFLVAGLFFGIDRALYSLLAYFITSKVIDEISEGFDSAKAALIITEDGKKISELIYKKLGRTCTTIKGKGLLSGDKSVLYCVITRIEVAELRKIVRENDFSAFVTINDVQEIIGNHIKNSNIKIPDSSLTTNSNK